MPKGKEIDLRLVRESDLDRLHNFHRDIANRGSFYPVGVVPKPVSRKRFLETGFWQKKDGLLLIVSHDDQLIGQIEFYPTVPHQDELEISYIVYTNEHRGKGVATESKTSCENEISVDKVKRPVNISVTGFNPAVDLRANLQRMVKCPNISAPNAGVQQRWSNNFAASPPCHRPRKPPGIKHVTFRTVPARRSAADCGWPAGRNRL